MRENLCNLCVQVPKYCTYVDAMYIYDMYASTHYSTFRTIENNVIGTKYSPCDFATKNKLIMLVDFRNGGRLIPSNNIKDKIIPDIISLLAEIVSFEGGNFASFDNMIFD